jgi:hypothetical protein
LHLFFGSLLTITGRESLAPLVRSALSRPFLNRNTKQPNCAAMFVYWFDKYLLTFAFYFSLDNKSDRSLECDCHVNNTNVAVCCRAAGPPQFPLAGESCD